MRLPKAAALALALLAGGCGVADAPDLIAGAEEVSVPDQADVLVVFLSGIGGWRNDIDRQTAELLAEAGHAVVGFDSPEWFGVRRSPAEVAAHLTAIIEAYSERTAAEHVALVGYSFGANILPAAYNAMPEQEREALDALVMIAPNRRARQVINILHRAGIARAQIDLAPELLRIPKDRLTCIYPEAEESFSGCTMPEIEGARVVRLPGDHDFDGDANAVAGSVMRALGEIARQE